jgi:hypothetical protein
MKIDANFRFGKGQAESAHAKVSFARDLFERAKTEKVPDFIGGNRPVNNS